MDKETGDMFSGKEAADMIGGGQRQAQRQLEPHNNCTTTLGHSLIPSSSSAGGSGRVSPSVLESWRVFVQSTSYNRALMADTGFLYEVDPEH